MQCTAAALPVRWGSSAVATAHVGSFHEHDCIRRAGGYLQQRGLTGRSDARSRSHAFEEAGQNGNESQSETALVVLLQRRLDVSCTGIAAIHSAVYAADTAGWGWMVHACMAGCTMGCQGCI